jgi:predicted O-methyltransferase YrrM
VVIEIGTADGGTLFVFTALAHPRADIVSIDLPGGADGGGYPRWKRSLYRSFASEHQKMHLIRGDSHSRAQRVRVERILGGRPVDFLFIDGDDTYAGAQADFDWYAPLVRPGGLIALHDICRHPPGTSSQVDRLWRELRAARKGEEIIEDPEQGWAGIGLLFV